MKRFAIVLFGCICSYLSAQNYDLSGEWKGFAYQLDDGVSWNFTSTFDEKNGEIIGGTYYIDADDPSVWSVYKIKGKVVGNTFHYEEYEIIKDKNRAGSVWCYVVCDFQIQQKGDSLFLISEKAPSWTKEKNVRRCSDAKMVFKKKITPKIQHTIDIPDNIKQGQKITVNSIQFAPSRTDILTESYPVLEEIVQYLKSHPGAKVEIRGHTDIGKNPEYNEKLSLQRAEAVKSYLVNRGIQTIRLTTKGLGSSEPIADNQTAEGRKKNRRTEFVFMEIN